MVKVDSIQFHLTENIMVNLFNVPNIEGLGLDENEYEQVFTAIYKELDSLGINDRLSEQFNAVERYRGLIRKKYQKRADSLNEHFPRGMFTKTKSGELVGIDVMMKSIVKSLCELTEIGFEPLKDRILTEQDLLSLGFVRIQPLQVEPEFMYDWLRLKKNDSVLEVTTEYDLKKIPTKQYFDLNGETLKGRAIGIEEIKLIKSFM